MPLKYAVANGLLRPVRSVVFRSLNFERAHLVLQRLFGYWDDAAGPGRNITAAELGSLSPAAVAREERLLLPAPLGESLLRTSATLSGDDPVAVRAALQQFEGERTAVVVQARLVSSALDAALVANGVRPGRLFLAGNSTFASEVPGDRVPVVLSPQILLHRDASAADVFRAAVIANHLVHVLSSQPVWDVLRAASSADAIAALNNVPAECVREAWRLLWARRIYRTRRIVGNAIGVLQRAVRGSPAHEAHMVAPTSSSGTTHPLSSKAARLLSSLGLAPTQLADMVERSRQFEQPLRGDIQRTLQGAGWETDRFVFSAAPARMEW
jgi:hypothetical protein